MCISQQRECALSSQTLGLGRANRTPASSSHAILSAYLSALGGRAGAHNWDCETTPPAIWESSCTAEDLQYVVCILTVSLAQQRQKKYSCVPSNMFRLLLCYLLVPADLPHKLMSCAMPAQQRPMPSSQQKADSAGLLSKVSLAVQLSCCVDLELILSLCADSPSLPPPRTSLQRLPPGRRLSRLAVSRKLLVTNLNGNTFPIWIPSRETKVLSWPLSRSSTVLGLIGGFRVFLGDWLPTSNQRALLLPLSGPTGFSFGWLQMPKCRRERTSCCDLLRC